MRTEPLDLLCEEEEDELEWDGAERELEETRAEERDGAEREPEEICGEDRETEREEEPKLLDDEDELGAGKMDRVEDPEKERSRGALLRDVVEPEKDREGRLEGKPRLLTSGACPRSRFSP